MSGVFLPVVALLTHRRLRAIDDVSSVPERELSAARGRAAVRAAPGDDARAPGVARRPSSGRQQGASVVTQGEPGDLFYVIASGEVDVIRGRHTRPCPDRRASTSARSRCSTTSRAVASCVAHTHVELFALDRERFVAAVGGDARSAALAADAIEERLGELDVVRRSSGLVDGLDREERREAEQHEP